MDIYKHSIISYEDCKRIISRYIQSDEFKVLNYEISPFSDTLNGFLGDHLLCKIKYWADEKTEEVSFFAKRFPFENETLSNFMLSVKAFSKEILIYEVLFEKFRQVAGFRSDFAPNYYFGKDNEIIVLEDLSAKGYVLVQHQNAFTLDHIKLGLKVLAQFHAGSIGFQEMKSKALGTKYILTDEYPELMQEPIFEKCEHFLGYSWCKARFSALTAMIDLLPTTKDISKDVFKKKLADLAEKSFEIVKYNKNYYNTLCHNDMWAKNFMFQYENGVPVECKLIDFQLQHYSPPANDVLLFIYLNTSAETRKQHLHKLLYYYHEYLREELQNGNLDIDNIISYKDFETSVHYILPYIKLRTAYCRSFQRASTDFYKKIARNASDFRKFLFEDGAPFSTELFKTDENYKKLMTETLEDLRDFIIHPRITLEDCFKIIGSKLNTSHYQLLSRSLVHLKRNCGYFSDNYNLKINIHANGYRQTLHFFAKFVPESKISSNISLGSKAFVKESFFFQQLIPLIQRFCRNEIEECITPCYLSRLNDVIVFDDMELLQYYSADPQIPFDAERLKVVIKKLAIYHATSIIVEEKMSEKMSKLFRLGDCFLKELQENFFLITTDNPCSEIIETGIKIVDFLIDLFPDWNSTISQVDFKKKAKKAFEALYELVKPSQRYRNVVCHGDLWTSNIMIKYYNEKPVDCRIIDYQLLRYSPPAHDLLCLIYLTTNRKVRSECMSQLIDLYYEVFKSVLNKYGYNVNGIYSLQDFVESCEYMRPQAICQTVLYYQFTMTKSEFLSEYTTSTESTKKIFLENRQGFITDMCERDSIYRDRMHESIQDLREMCLKYF